MSWKALAWAAKCRVKHSADKLVLLGLAERHNEETGTAYPSIDWLAEFGSLNRKTVIAALDRLEAAGLIGDSGQRTGKTRQVKAYALHLETVPKAEQSQKRNSPVFSKKQSQKRDTEPVREPSSVAKATSPRGSRIPLGWKPDPLPPNVASLVAQWPPGREQRELEGFCDYWAARTRDACRLDWNLTWHNRIRDQHDRITGNGRSTALGRHQSARPASSIEAARRVFGTG